MGTTADKLNAVLASKNAIRDAITEKIGEPAGDIMSAYAEKIRGIEEQKKYTTTLIDVSNTITDPATMVTLIDDSGAIQAIRDNSHRYLVKKTSDGEVTICQLDDNDSNYYADGTVADLTGSDGDVMMKLPTFWYKINSTKYTLWYGYEPYGEEWKKWDGNTLIGVYKANLLNNKLYSRSGVVPSGNMTHTEANGYASNRGNGYSLTKLGHHAIMASLFLFWYKNTNSQAICGSGISYSNTIVNGQTNNLGMEDTTPNNGVGHPVNFWGLENWWGERYEFIGNCELTSANTIKVTDDPISGTSNLAIPSESGYQKKFSFYGISNAIGASSTTGLCDGFLAGVAQNIMARGRNDRDLYDGIFYLDASRTKSYSHLVYGARITFTGNIKEINSSKDFKAITAVE